QPLAAADEAQVLQNRQRIVKRRPLRQIAHVRRAGTGHGASEDGAIPTRLGVRIVVVAAYRRSAPRRTKEFHRTRVWLVVASDQPQRGGLPATIRTEQPHDFARLHTERNTVQDLA